MGHRESEADGDGGVNGVTTGFQDRDTDVRCEGFLGDDHAFAGEDRFVGVRLLGYQT
jgi:hypothetical protein